MKIRHLVIFSIALSSLSVSASNPQIQIRKIWDNAPHNAFTDLLKFKGNYYCSFREGSGHIPGTDGVVRILKSSNGQEWQSIALLEKKGIDLRDPKLSITPDGRIMVIIGGAIYQERKLLGRSPQVSFSDKSGMQFSAPEKVTIDPEIASWGDWIWRVTWYKGTGYGIDYQIGPRERKGPTAMYLVKTNDGRTFEKVSKIELDGFPNEATIRFDKKGKMYVLIRRELGDQKGIWAKSTFPYTQWSFKKLDIRLGGPNFIFTKNDKTIVGTRLYTSESVGLFGGNKKGKLREIMQLPSSGDRSYPGLLLEKDRLLVSYYSSHEGKTKIYIAEVPIAYINKQQNTQPNFNEKQNDNFDNNLILRMI